MIQTSSIMWKTKQIYHQVFNADSVAQQNIQLTVYYRLHMNEYMKVGRKKGKGKYELNNRE